LYSKKQRYLVASIPEPILRSLYRSAYYVYIAHNRGRRVYISQADDLWTAMRWHKAGAIDPHCRLHRIDMLSYFERFDSALDAEQRLEELKRLSRRRLKKLITGSNRRWADLSAAWFPVAASSRGDDELDGGVLARLHSGPPPRAPGYEQAWPREFDDLWCPAVSR
jgi:predicted GIY-YIG superfamily endonuclease